MTLFDVEKVRAHIHAETRTHPLLCGIFYSRPLLMRLVGRINTCQVGALVQYRRGQTVTESCEKIIILIMMPWRAPFIYQSTPPPSICHPVSRSTLLSTPWLQFDWFPAQTASFFFSLVPNCYSLFFHSILLCYSRWHNFTSFFSFSPKHWHC